MDSAPALARKVLVFPSDPPPPPPEPAQGDAPRGFLHLLLHRHEELSARLREGGQLAPLALQLLGMSLLGFAVHGFAVGLVAQFLDAPGSGHVDLGAQPVLWLPLAFALSLVGALGVCLPIFWFCSHVAGLDAPLRLVAAQALRANATGSALLLGLLPFYVAYALGTQIGVLGSADAAVSIGLALPFAVGLFGIRSVYVGFADLARALPTGIERRRALLLVMVLCAAIVYAAVAPVALYRLAQAFGANA